MVNIDYHLIVPLNVKDSPSKEEIQKELHRQDLMQRKKCLVSLKMYEIRFFV